MYPSDVRPNPECPNCLLCHSDAVFRRFSPMPFENKEAKLVRVPTILSKRIMPLSRPHYRYKFMRGSGTVCRNSRTLSADESHLSGSTSSNISRLLRSPSALRVAARDADTDKAYLDDSRGHRRNPSHMTFTNNEQRRLVNDYSSSGPSVWQSPIRQRLGTAHEAIDASTSCEQRGYQILLLTWSLLRRSLCYAAYLVLQEHGAAHVPAGGIAHSVAAKLSKDPHTRGRKMHRAVAAAVKITAGTDQAPLVQGTFFP